MSGIFKQYAWLFDLIAILLCSFFLAKIVSVYLGKKFEVQRSIGVMEEAEVKTASREVKPLSNYQVIIDRNIFDSSEVPVEAKEGEEGEGEAVEAIPGGKAVKTSLPIKVWAVLVVGDGRDKRSSATIESSGAGGGKRGRGGAVEVFAVGQEPSFAPNTKLVKVAPDRIEFVNGGRLEYAELVDETGESIFAAPREKGPSVAEAGPGKSAPGTLIKTEGAGKFVIDQREVDKAIGNIDKLYTEIRAVPSFADGKMSGMKVLSVKRGSVFEKLGLRRGDVLKKINGMELDVRKGFEIFSQLKDSKSLTLDLIRQGQPRTFEYEIR
jgi:general secretion pathway protein C